MYHYTGGLAIALALRYSYSVTQGMYDSKSESGFFTELRSQCTGPQVYMAPEAMEKFEFTATADVYSFGKRVIMPAACHL